MLPRRSQQLRLDMGMRAGGTSVDTPRTFVDTLYQLNSSGAEYGT
jgi:hypothetical protein